MTSTTIAALPIVEATEGMSKTMSVSNHTRKEAVEPTLSNNVAGDIVTKGQVASDCHKKINTTGTTDAGKDD